MQTTIDQTSFAFPKSIRINGDQFFQTAEEYRQAALWNLRKAAIFEEMAIAAWAEAESQCLSVSVSHCLNVSDPYLQTR